MTLHSYRYISYIQYQIFSVSDVSSLTYSTNSMLRMTCVIAVSLSDSRNEWSGVWKQKLPYVRCVCLARCRKNEYGYRSRGIRKDTLEGGHLEETEERRGKVRSPFSHMPSRLGNIITEIDAHLSDPSCSLPYGWAHAYVCVCVRSYGTRHRLRLQPHGSG